MIHVVNKGKNGEREIATMLREIIDLAINNIDNLNQSEIQRLQEAVQRNTNQSSSGGCDILLFGLAIEVKRQEILNLNAWWNQTVISATRNKSIPILIWRQNRKQWQVKMEVKLQIPNSEIAILTAGIISIEDFKSWFYHYAECYIASHQIFQI